jgi:hypothetical protein
MTILNWRVSNTDAALIRKIADRAMTDHPSLELTHLGITMDVQACHANGTPLDLTALLGFPAFDFTHDIIGIHWHLNRDTGKLEDFFVPRCTARAEV